MKFNALPLVLSIAFGAVTAPAFAGESDTQASTSTHKVEMQQVRNATVKITYAGTTFLIDPMLAKKGTYPGFEGTYRSNLRNPMVELPGSVEDVISGVDAVIVTHTHLDHWDECRTKSTAKRHSAVCTT